MFKFVRKILVAPALLKTIFLSAFFISNILLSANSFADKSNLDSNAPLSQQQNAEESLFDDNWQDDWGEEESASPWEITGFVEAAYGQFLQSNLNLAKAPLNEVTVRSNVDYNHALFELKTKAELRFDQQTNKNRLTLRELTIGFQPSKSLDIKAGRQILTWGTGDYLFINDLFPKDWQSFFSGRDDQYLKAPSDSLKATWYVQNIAFDAVWTKSFTPDNYLNGERFSFYSPMAQSNIAPEKFAVLTPDKSQWSGRISSSYDTIEWALYGYSGYWPTPVGLAQEQTKLIPYFPKLNTWGASVRAPVSSGILSMEYASYNSVEDQNGNNALIANGQHRLLIGYETEVISKLTANIQYYLEKTKDYTAFKQHSPYPAEIVDEYRQLLTLRLSYFLMQQKLRLSFFAFYSPSDQDYYLKPSINYRYSDTWSMSAGANIFDGRQQYSFFGQHQQNTNAWLRIKAQF